MMYMKSKFRSF